MSGRPLLRDHDDGRVRRAGLALHRLQPGSIEGSARILEWDGSVFVDVSTSNNPVTGKACAAEIEGFGIYALAGSNDGHPAADDPHRPAAGQRLEPGHVHLHGRPARRVAHVLDRRREQPALPDRAVGPVRVAEDVHVPRARQPQVRGPGDGAGRVGRRRRSCRRSGSGRSRCRSTRPLRRPRSSRARRS